MATFCRYIRLLRILLFYLQVHIADDDDSDYLPFSSSNGCIMIRENDQRLPFCQRSIKVVKLLVQAHRSIIHKRLE